MNEYEGFDADNRSVEDDDGSEDYEEYENGENGEHMVINPTSVRERIDQTLEVLANLRNRKAESSESRSDLIASLARYVWLQQYNLFFISCSLH